MDKGKSVDDKENTGSPIVIPPTPLLKRIGFGTGVNVYHLDRSPLDSKLRSPWALKKVNKTHMGGAISKRMFDEAQILKTLNHPNIIGFRGYTRTDDGKEVLALEECTECLGNLIEDRRDSTQKIFLPKQIIKIAKGMAAGLDYLHTMAHLIHGDIKSYNVLVKDGNFEMVKLCDFGISVRVDDDGVPLDKDADCMGTLAWSSPEVVAEGPITTKSDIFSLGLTLWEMMTLDVPHLDLLGLDETGSSDVMDESLILGAETYGQRPPLPDLGPAYKEIVKIFEWCTEEDPNKRPSAKNLLDVLDRIQL